MRPASFLARCLGHVTYELIKNSTAGALNLFLHPPKYNNYLLSYFWRLLRDPYNILIFNTFFQFSLTIFIYNTFITILYLPTDRRSTPLYPPNGKNITYLLSSLSRDEAPQRRPLGEIAMRGFLFIKQISTNLFSNFKATTYSCPIKFELTPPPIFTTTCILL